MPAIRVDDLADPRLAHYRHVPDPALLRTGEIFVAEGRLVVRLLLSASPYRARSVLVTETAFDALRDVIEPRLPDLDVFLVAADAIERLTGFNIHRGCLAIGERPAPLDLEALVARTRAGGGGEPSGPSLSTARTLIALERVGNADNVGAVFRNAAAFGVDAVVLGPGCCDPLYRKAIRVSMGAALRVPFVAAGAWPEAIGRLRAAGFTVAALSTETATVPIDRFAASWKRGAPLALLAGSEGDGLSEDALAAADVAVRIPMAAGIDSLNIATATGIALHRLAG